MILTIQGLKTYPESPVLPWNQLTPWHFFKNLVTEVFIFCKFSQTPTGGYNKIKEPPNTDHDPNVFVWLFKWKSDVNEMTTNHIIITSIHESNVTLISFFGGFGLVKYSFITNNIILTNAIDDLSTVWTWSSSKPRLCKLASHNWQQMMSSTTFC
jgi:hypothetical protein